MSDVQVTIIDSADTQVVSSVPGIQGPVGQGFPSGGTANQVLFKQSSTSYDAVWGNVTSAMIGNLEIVDADVSASAAIAGTKVSPNFGSQNIISTGTGTAASFIPTSSTVPANGVYLPAANNVAISTNSTGRLFVDSSGRVGLGTSTPTENLHLSGSNRSILLQSTNANDSYESTRIINDNGDFLIQTFNSAGSFVGNDYIIARGASGAVAHQFLIGNTERVRIDSSGRVGIGASAPGNLLELKQNTPAFRQTSVAESGGYVATFGLGYSTLETFIIEANATSASPTRILQWGTNGNFSLNYSSTSTSRAFIINDGATERFRIDSAGYVGIGTASPTNTLTVQGSVSFNLNSTTDVFKFFTGGAGLAYAGTTTATAIGLITNGAERLRVDTAGRLLVGTSSGANVAGVIPAVQVFRNNLSELLNLHLGFNGGAAGARVILSRSRNATHGSSTILQNGDEIGGIYFIGDDGVNYNSYAARIYAEVDGTPGANDMPGRLIFSTTADGSSSTTERLRIDSTGQIEASSLGTAAAPVLTWLTDNNTGIYSPGADQLAISTNGTQKFTIDNFDGNPIIDTDFPSITPTLDLAFALTKQLDPRITFSRASSATFVGANGLIQSAATDVARFDHNPVTGESLGLLVEEERTNGLNYSEETSQWGTLTNIIPTDNQAVAPNGSLTADQYIETSATGLHVQDGTAFTFVTGTVYTYSVFVKSIGGRNFEIGYPPTIFTNRFARFTLSGSGSVQGSDAGVTASIQAYANGWYRCSATNTCAAGASSRIGNFIINDSFSRSYAGDVTKGLFIWGAQLEAGAFPTSYIPTTTATVTRSADVASITGANFSSWYRQDEGTVFADVNSAPINTITQVAFDVSEGVGNERFFQRRNGAGSIAVAMIDGATTQSDIGPVSISGSTRYRSGYAYKVNDLELVVNGGGSATDTSATLPTVSQINIGQNFGVGQHVNGTIRRLTYWPTRLSNATLQALTK
jgi:hypothetical protein